MSEHLVPKSELQLFREKRNKTKDYLPNIFQIPIFVLPDGEKLSNFNNLI